jgi:hypothetical protein
MEILKFSAETFLWVTEGLGKLDFLLGLSSSDFPLPEAHRKEMQSILPKLRNHCAFINLTLSLKSIDRLSESINSNPGMMIKELKDGCDELRRRIIDEVSDNLFLYIPKTHVTWYESENLFGDAVDQAFPSTSYDIKEAGKCLALRRNTAAVCHLIRVLEIGLRALAVKLKVPYDNKPWNYVIEVADKRLRKIREQKRKPKGWKNDEKFYSEAIAHFRFIKDAWRNYSMHVYERYDEEQAESVFNHTRAFMRHLATKLKE